MRKAHFLCFVKIQNTLKISNFAQFWTNLTHLLPFLDDDGLVLRGFDPILPENTQKQGVKSKNKFCLIKYPSHIMAPTLEMALFQSSHWKSDSII